jgi:hypothetical protein
VGWGRGDPHHHAAIGEHKAPLVVNRARFRAGRGRQDLALLWGHALELPTRNGTKPPKQGQRGLRLSGVVLEDEEITGLAVACVSSRAVPFQSIGMTARRFLRSPVAGSPR